jgi:hypothetical protein
MAVTTTTTQAVEPKVENTTNNAAAAPRKRRRRAPATGATDDCFACKKRQVKCDRRRPYCGQCVEMGKECSGYRTTLTWGVGVASRGKLRGLSLPIAKSPPTATTQEPKAQATRKSSVASTATTSRKTEAPLATAEALILASLLLPVPRAPCSQHRKSTSTMAQPVRYPSRLLLHL